MDMQDYECDEFYSCDLVMLHGTVNCKGNYLVGLPNHMSLWKQRVFSSCHRRQSCSRRQIWGVGADLWTQGPRGKEGGQPLRAEHGSQLTDLIPTAVRKWILPKSRELGKGPRTLDENAAPPNTWISASWDPEKRIESHYLQTSGLWKLWDDKCIFF